MKTLKKSKLNQTISYSKQEYEARASADILAAYNLFENFEKQSGLTKITFINLIKPYFITNE
jgi:hypothetical protein